MAELQHFGVLTPAEIKQSSFFFNTQTMSWTRFLLLTQIQRALSDQEAYKLTCPAAKA